MASASGKVEGTAIADSSMKVLMEQQQQQEEEEEVLPSGVCLFDHIDDLVPFFPRENALDFSGEDGCLSFITVPSKDVEVSDPETTTISSNHRHDQLFEDTADFDWLSTFMDEPPFSLDFFPAQDVYFQTLSPVSVLEPNGVTANASSSTCSSTTTAISSAGEGRCTTRHDGNFEVSTNSSPDPISIVPGRARSKRSRRSSTGMKFKIIKKSSASIDVVREVDQSGSARKCRHCQIQRTPQWREGPMGPKTLCNACGVRYKSGRLFPEYRPAASPTFVSSRHSNSHRKVVEMRINNATTSRRGCDLLDCIRVRPPTRED